MGLTFDGEIVVGKFVDRERPTWEHRLALACLLLGLQLAPSEIDALLRVSPPTLVDLAGRLDDRICRFDGRRPDCPAREN